MIEGLEHVGIGVRDLEKSVAFYRDMLGFEVAMERDLNVPASRIKKLVFMRRGDDMIELLSMPEGNKGVESYETTGVSHICFTVQGIKEEIEKWTRLGIPQSIPPTPTADGGLRTAFRGPDGEHIELRGK